MSNFAHAQRRLFAAMPVNVRPPPRVQRSPICLAESLNSCVTATESSVHAQRYVSDPYLMPTSYVMTRATFARNREEGRKAARWLVRKWPTLFLWNRDQPTIHAFHKEGTSDAPGDPSEAGVLEMIKNRRVLAAWTTFEKATDQGAVVSDETTRKLLQMLCYYNSADTPLDEDLCAEFTYFASTPAGWQKRSGGTTSVPESWNAGSAADSLFDSIEEPKSPEMYSIMMSGLSKWREDDRALKMLRHCIDNKIPLSASAVSEVLSGPLQRLDISARFDLIADCTQKVQLSAGSSETAMQFYLSVLRALSISARGEPGRLKELLYSCLSEMNNLDAPLSPGAFYMALSLLSTTNADSSEIYSVLIESLSYLESKSDLPTYCEEDFQFFPFAMKLLKSKLQFDSQLCERVHDLLCRSNNNARFLNTEKSTSLYFNTMISILCVSEDARVVMEKYERLAPHVCSLQKDTVEELIHTCVMHDAWQYLPRLWSDGDLLGFTWRSSFLTSFLTSFIHLDWDNVSSEKIHVLRQLCRKITSDTEGFIDYVQQRNEHYKDAEPKGNMANRTRDDELRTWTPEHVKNLSLIAIRCDDLDLALRILQYSNIQLSDAAYFYVSLMEEWLLRSSSQKRRVATGALRLLAVAPPSVTAEMAQRLRSLEQVYDELTEDEKKLIV